MSCFLRHHATARKLLEVDSQILTNTFTRIFYTLVCVLVKINV